MGILNSHVYKGQTIDGTSRDHKNIDGDVFCVIYFIGRS